MLYRFLLLLYMMMTSIGCLMTSHLSIEKKEHVALLSYLVVS